ncbi:CD3324 family protein [Dethiothermospora halolimnae]|uniref:CD3324 family protein n=1 Tax=Dethiothermospora halolimnae TaxID=3114390 RepID=UPI003CCB9C31
MDHINAKTILPDNLVLELQKYIEGGYLYIPSKPQSRKKWGENSGKRNYIKKRNEHIVNKYKNGHNINKLAKEFFLSIDSIKKIVYGKKS